MNAQVQLQLFVGCLLTSEIRLHISLSKEWQQDKILHIKKELFLQEVRYQEKEYIGIAIAHETVSTARAEQIAFEVQNKIAYYCPEINTNTLTTVIFPQIFLG